MCSTPYINMDNTLSLMVVYVTLQQEKAIKAVYKYHDWKLANLGEKIPSDMKMKIKEIDKENNILSTNLDEQIKEEKSSENCSTDQDSSPQEILDSVTHCPDLDIKHIVNTGYCSDGITQPQGMDNSVESLNKRKMGRKKSKERTSGSLKDDHKKDEAAKVYKCKQCSYTSKFSSNFLRHVREIHCSVRHQCSQCEKSFKSKHEAKRHEQNAHVNCLHCDKCDKEFTSRGGLLNHYKQVHEKKSLYQCTECDATFFYKQHYEGHLNKHKLCKPFTCKKCNKPFIYKSSLNVHQKSCKGGNYFDSHNEDGSLKKSEKQSFLCDICGDELSNRSSLKTHHKFLHSGEAKVECSICGKTFKGQYSLKRHKNTAHSDSGGALHSCDVCQKVFSQVQVLRQHMRRHKQEFSVHCATCGKGFYSNYKLKEHERTHTGEKPFTCGICGNFKCSTKTNLLKHFKVHERGKKIREKKKENKDANTAPVNVENQVSTKTSHLIPLTKEVELHSSGVGLREGENHMYKHPDLQVEGISDGYGTEHHMHHQGHNSNVVTMTGDMRYDQQHYTLLQSSDGSYDHRMQGDGYYDNIQSSSPAHIPQGLNILTVAMNMVNPGPY